MNPELARAYAKALIIITGLLPSNARCQKINNIDRDRAQVMLQEIAADVKKHYYDPTFHGLNWDAKVQEVKQKINTTDSMNSALAQVAGALDSLNDSHAFFLPPSHAYRHDYGWQAEVIGDHCFVIRVRPGSDAEKRGVKPGDELVALNGYNPSRENLRKMQYVYNTLNPQPALTLNLRDPAGKQRQVELVTTIIEKKRLTDLTTTSGDTDIWQMIRDRQDAAHLGRTRFVDLSDDVGVLKFPGFHFNESEIDTMIGKARKHKALVLDLRGNPGGRINTLDYLIGSVFEKEVKVFDRVGRSLQKPLVSKSSGHPFTGKLFVLLDSDSASSAEMFARVIQIEKRGTVFGDRSSGSVMEALHYQYKVGVDTVVYFGASITDANLVMTDGKSLEHNGVIPDEVVLPSAEDLASGRDPVLARAVEAAGAKISPEAAGKLFPYEWPNL